MDSIQLVKKAKAGDKEALVKLIMLRKDEYYKLAYAYTGEKDDALDALSDMILILYEKIRKLRKEDAFYIWSKTILVNCCRKLLKKKSKLLPLMVAENHPRRESLEEYVAKEQRVDLQKMLLILSVKQQEAIKLRFFLDLEYKVISQILKIPEGTVKSRIFVGLKNLKEKFGGEY